MTQDQGSGKRTAWLQRLSRFSSFGIRAKIVLPYLILTLIVAIVGIYVVTTLVASSLDERLTNQLLDAGRTVSDGLVNWEMKHIESARLVAFTVGLAEALQDGDRDSLITLAQPVASVQGMECLIVADARGQSLLHVMRQDDGSYEIVEQPFDISKLNMVQDLLSADDPHGLIRRGLGYHRVDQRRYYFTAIPVELDSEVVGVVVVGTSLDTLLTYFKRFSLADVIVYDSDGHASNSTFIEQPDDIEPQLYDEILHSTGYTRGENLSIQGRSYRLARGPLHVGNETMAVFGVALPSNFIVQASADSRNTYTAIFITATALVVVVGYLIAQRITNPIKQLVSASQSVADGRLDQRTGIIGTDEIGTLAMTFDDMTSRLEERTHALEEALGRLRAILSSIGDGVLLENVAGEFETLNTTAGELLMKMATQFELGPLREPSSGELTNIPDPQASPWLLDRRQFEIGQKVIRTYSAPVETDEGKQLGTVTVLRDVTVEVEAERLKDAFITHVSHELRTPLTAIKGYSELLLANSAGVLSEGQRGFINTINRHTDSLVTMVNTLLDFSEMEAVGRLGLRQQPIQLSDLVKEIAEKWRPRMDEKDLTFEVETSTDLPMVNADTRRLSWAIISLVRNAWQHTPAGGSVKMRLFDRDDHVVLDVADTGSGISPQDQQRIFSRFYNVTQVVQSADNEARGLGVSLYVTKSIIEAHRGKVGLVSKEGEGSTFSVILPALPDRQDKKRDTV